MTMDYEKAYKDALNRAKHALDCHNQGMVSTGVSLITSIFPELCELEDEKVRRAIIDIIKSQKEQQCHIDSTIYDEMLAWLEKQGKSSDQIHYWTEEEIEPIISDYLRGAEHYGGMIGRLRCLKPKSLEKQSETYTKRDVDEAYIEGMASAKRELEKQDEQKPFDYENANIQQKDFAPKVKWKPSDEQMADLWNMLCECRPADHQLLQDIYYGLKRLREE